MAIAFEVLIAIMCSFRHFRVLFVISVFFSSFPRKRESIVFLAPRLRGGDRFEVHKPQISSAIGRQMQWPWDDDKGNRRGLILEGL
jgi:hypothetical protein